MTQKIYNQKSGKALDADLYAIAAALLKFGYTVAVKTEKTATGKPRKVVVVEGEET